MITFAGVDITPTRVPADVQAVLDQWWHGHRIEEFERTGYFTGLIEHLPIDNPPRVEAPRIGVLTWPSGASRWATCHLILDDTRLDSIRTAVGSPATAQALVIDDGTTSVTSDMWLVGVRPIGQREAGRDLYLVTLVDERYWWWHSGDEQAPAAPASWTSLLDDLFASVGVASPTIDAPHADYGTPDTDAWAIGYRPLPLIIDAACMTVGLRVVRQLDGSVTCQNYDTAAAADEVQWTAFSDEVLTGGRIEVADIVRSMPDSVQVVFSDGGINKTLAGLAISEFSGLAGVASRAARIRGDGDMVDVYATQAAKDWYKWGLSRTDCTIRGVVARPITGLDDRLEWVHLPGDGGIVTRVIRPPWGERNTWSGELTATDPDGGGIASPCDQNANSDSTWLVDRAAHVEMASEPDAEKRTFTYEVFAGAAGGRCACINEQGRNPAVYPYPYTAFYDAMDDLWIGSATIKTCCGCARLLIDIPEENDDDVDDQPPMQAWLRLTDACDASGTATDYALKFLRICGNSALFAGGSTRLCDGVAPFGCENGFLILITCDTCRLENVECENCQETCAPPVLRIPTDTFLNTYAVYDGPWDLHFDDDCRWTITCGAITVSAVITIDAILDTATMTVTYSGGPGTVEYEIEMAEMLFPCFQTSPGAGTLTVTDGDTADTPDTITWVPIYCVSCQTECCLGLAPDTMELVLKDPLGPTEYGSATLTKTTPVGEDDILDIVWTGSGSFAVPGCLSAGTVEWELHCLASDGLWIRHRCAGGDWSTLILISAVPAECSPLSGGHLGYDLSGSAGATCAGCDPVSLVVSEP